MVSDSGVTLNFVGGGLNILGGGGAKHTICQILGADLVILLIEIPNIGGGAKAAPHSPPRPPPGVTPLVSEMQRF